MLPSYTKDPDGLLDYAVDWSEWLPEGDTIASASWLVDDADLVIESSTATSTVATVRVSGGVVGTRYQLTNRITTVTGLVTDQTLRIRIREK